MLYLDQKYLNLLSPQLEQFKQKDSTVWNVRCFVCGDSKKNKNKTRGFFFESDKNSLVYYCHNCSASLSFSHVLKELNPNLYQEYLLEKLKDENNSEPKSLKKRAITTIEPTIKEMKARSISSLSDNHPAKQYITRRQIPIQHWDNLFYTDNFSTWLKRKDLSESKYILYDEPRILIPFFDLDKSLILVQGRSLEPKAKLRYITIVFKENRPKIFGLERLNRRQQIYAVEGPIDSLFIPNCLAVANSDISSGLDKLDLNVNDITIIHDNEKRNKEIIKQYRKSIDLGYKVVIFPDDIIEKDINDMILKGLDVMKIIQNNTYQGIIALAKLNEWKNG